MNELPVESIGKCPTLGHLECPDPNWSLDQLGQCAKYHDDQCVGLGRKMAVHRFREGHALSIARGRMPHGEWRGYLAKHGISKSTDDRVRKLYDEVGSEKELEGMTIMEAYEEYGIEKPRVPQTPVQDEPEEEEEEVDGPEVQQQAGDGPDDEYEADDAEGQDHDPEPDDEQDVGEEAPEHEDEDDAPYAENEPEVPQASTKKLLKVFQHYSGEYGWSKDEQIRVLVDLLYMDRHIEGLLEQVVKVGYADRLEFQLENYHGPKADQQPKGLYGLLDATKDGLKQFRDEQPDEETLDLIDDLIGRLQNIKNTVCV